MQVKKQLTGLVLMKYGFVHVTNLPARKGDEEYRISMRTGENGRHDYNNGMLVAITFDGEVWLQACPIHRDMYPDLDETLTKLCPKTGDTFVPCSNGEAIPSYMILNRVSDPYWDGGMRYPPEPDLFKHIHTEVKIGDRTPALLPSV